MIFFLFLVLPFFIFVQPVHAIYDPLSVPNNRYGIHIVDNNDIPELPGLVNTAGGDWGYVTMVLSDNERDSGRWQTTFDQMRRMHLIPIIRMATHAENGVWVKPTKDRFYEIVTLLNGLNWPTENRYVILYNEPNHANEWGGTLDPEDYADTFVQFAKALKAANKDFFILPAGLDASAADDGIAMDEAVYLSRMTRARPEMLSLMDGWTSHSYPNPAFSGSPYARGRGTISTFDWELGYLKELGLTKNLPVFITETGWERGAVTAGQVAANFQIAASSIWLDSRIAAVTPFIYKYLGMPFDRFSWKTMDNAGFYPQYFTYQQIQKVSGEPKQLESYTLMSDLLPAKLVANSTYALSAFIENSGQGIIDPTDGYTLQIISGGAKVETFVDPLPTVEPKEKGQIMIHLKTPPMPGPLPLIVQLSHHGTNSVLQARTVDIVPPPSVQVQAHLGWRTNNTASDVTVILYDRDMLLQKFPGLSLINGTITVKGLTNIVPGLPYRIVILVPGYLPRQVIGALSATNTVIYPSRFLPLDFDNDGAFTLSDIKALIQFSPWTAILRFFGP